MNVNKWKKYYLLLIVVFIGVYVYFETLPDVFFVVDRIDLGRIPFDEYALAQLDLNNQTNNLYRIVDVDFPRFIAPFDIEIGSEVGPKQNRKINLIINPKKISGPARGFLNFILQDTDKNQITRKCEIEFNSIQAIQCDPKNIFVDCSENSRWSYEVNVIGVCPDSIQDVSFVCSSDKITCEEMGWSTVENRQSSLKIQLNSDGFDQGDLSEYFIVYDNRLESTVHLFPMMGYVHPEIDVVPSSLFVQYDRGDTHHEKIVLTSNTKENISIESITCNNRNIQSKKTSDSMSGFQSFEIEIINPKNRMNANVLVRCITESGKQKCVNLPIFIRPSIN